MSKVLVDDHDLEAIRFGRKIGVNGKEGTCYFSEEDNQVVKIYHMYLPRRKVYFDGSYGAQDYIDKVVNALLTGNKDVDL